MSGNKKPVEHISALVAKANELDLIKGQLEKEYNQALQLLKECNVSTKDLLVDSDGFPRTDIPVADVRRARAKIVRLRNDLKSNAKLRESLVSEYFASQEASGEPGQAKPNETNASPSQ